MGYVPIPPMPMPDPERDPTDAEIESELREEGYRRLGIDYVGGHGEYPKMRKDGKDAWRMRRVRPAEVVSWQLPAADPAARIVEPYVARAKLSEWRWETPWIARVLLFTNALSLVLALIYGSTLYVPLVGFVLSITWIVWTGWHRIATDPWEAAQDVLAADYAADKLDPLEMDRVAAAIAAMAILDPAERRQDVEEITEEWLKKQRLGTRVILRDEDGRFIGTFIVEQIKRGARAGKRGLVGGSFSRASLNGRRDLPAPFLLEKVSR